MIINQMIIGKGGKPTINVSIINYSSNIYTIEYIDKNNINQNISVSSGINSSIDVAYGSLIKITYNNATTAIFVSEDIHINIFASGNIISKISNNNKMICISSNKNLYATNTFSVNYNGNEVEFLTSDYYNYTEYNSCKKLLISNPSNKQVYYNCELLGTSSSYEIILNYNTNIFICGNDHLSIIEHGLNIDADSICVTTYSHMLSGYPSSSDCCYIMFPPEFTFREFCNSEIFNHVGFKISGSNIIDPNNNIVKIHLSEDSAEAVTPDTVMSGSSHYVY